MIVVIWVFSSLIISNEKKFLKSQGLQWSPYHSCHFFDGWIFLCIWYFRKRTNSNHVWIYKMIKMYGWKTNRSIRTGPSEWQNTVFGVGRWFWRAFYETTVGFFVSISYLFGSKWNIDITRLHSCQNGLNDNIGLWRFILGP